MLFSLDFTVPLTLAALLIETLVGYPAPVYRAIRHPVTWIGAFLSRLETGLNQSAWSNRARRAAGILALLILLGVVGGFAVLISTALSHGWPGFLVLAILAATLPAQRSLHEHVAAVAKALEGDGLDAGRRAVAMIVGRDTNVLDEAGVARAAIESLAENFSDGVVAPTFWTAAMGLPGGVLYKAANTADSMIGHKNARYADFGWAAARFDDFINLPASRLSALWLMIGAVFIEGADPSAALQSVLRDARRHRSPNAGWPEAAMAGALDLKLAGPRVYGAEMVEDVYMGSGRREATARDIRRALSVYRAACIAQILALAGITLILRA